MSPAHDTERRSPYTHRYIPGFVLCSPPALFFSGLSMQAIDALVTVAFQSEPRLSLKLTINLKAKTP